MLPMPEPTPTPAVGPTPTPRRTPRPTPKPTPTPAFTPAPAPQDWICDGSEAVIPDPFLKGWNIRRVDWGRRGQYDRVAITLERYNPWGGNGTQAITHVLPPDEVASTLKVKAPKEGDTAIALGLFQDVRLNWALDQATGLPAVKWLTLGKDDNGYPWLVVGVDADACYSLQVPAWTAEDPKSQKSIQVFLDVQH